ncbi:MAG: hypothetical protein HYZ13_09150 [Acidobacteria bacterium]|nr:hypothetical protein [Acidobacteriota bacterium]
MSFHLATVYEVLPEKHGVLVAFRDLSAAYDVGRLESGFVRVAAERAHPTGGAAVRLPEVGELGVVLELDGGFLVWLCSLHWQDHHQIDPDPDLELHRHPSGVLRRIRANGDTEWLHPSGVRVTVSRDGQPLSKPKRKGEGFEPDGTVPHLVMAHPAVGILRLSPEGEIALEHASGGTINVSAEGNLRFQGFASTGFEAAAKRFVMEPLLDWLKAHTHASAAPGSPTSTPLQAGDLRPDTHCTPDTFKGP